MNPSTAAFDVREDLSQTVHEFNHEQNEAGYVGHRLFPVLPKANPSGKFPRVPLEEELTDFDVARNRDGSFKNSSMEWKDDSYDTQSKGLEASLDDETVRRYDDFFDAEFYENNRIRRAILRAFEIEAVTFATTVTNYVTSRVKGGLTAWTTSATASPISDIDDQREAMFLELGAEPNALFINRADMRTALKTKQVMDRIIGQNFQDAQADALNNPSVLASALDLPEVIVANSLKNTGQSRNLSRIWPTGYAVLARVALTDDPTELCYGRTMVWSPLGAVDGQRVATYGESYDKPEVAGRRVRQRANWGRKVLHVQAARLILINGAAQP